MQESFSNPAVLFLLGIVVSMIGGWAKSQVEQFTTRADRIEDRAGHSADRQGSMSEKLASVQSDVEGLKAVQRDVAEALQRLARLEEWRHHSIPRLDEADATSRAVIALSEQIKTVFKRLDAIPSEVVEGLKAHLRAAPAGARA